MLKYRLKLNNKYERYKCNFKENKKPVRPYNAGFFKTKQNI